MDKIIGSSGTDLAKLAANGTWLDGKRFASGASLTEIENWIRSLNINDSKGME